MTTDEVVPLVPERIQGQELFARWLLKKGDYESALSALDRAEVLNDARVEDEKPWTMGRAAYLAREKWEKPEVALVVDQLRLSAYEGLGDETAAADVVERIRAREAVLYETVIARADALNEGGGGSGTFGKVENGSGAGIALKAQKRFLKTKGLKFK